MGSSGAVLSGGTPRGTATEHGYMAESFDPSLGVTGSAMTSGTVYSVRLWVPQSGNVTNIGVYVNTAGATLTSGQCLAGLYTDAGSQIAVTGDQSTNWTSLGNRIMPLSGGAQAVTGGVFYRVLLLAVGTTPPQLERAGTGASAGVSLGLSGSTLRFGQVSTSQTALPASYTPSSTSTSTTWLVVLI